MEGEAEVPVAGPRAGDRVEVIRSVVRLEALAPAWEALWRDAPAATPFTSPAWLLPWCRHLHRGPLHVLAGWRGRDLAALLPGLVYRAGPRRILGLLGGGPSDYQDVIAADPAAVEPLLDRAAESGADGADLEALPAASPLLRATAPPGVASAVAPQETCPALPLPDRADALEGRASPKLLDDLRYRRRKLARDAGPVAFVRAGPEDLDALLADLFRLHRARWAARGEAGVLGGEGLARFHRAAARSLLALGRLRLWALRAGGSTLGVLHAVAGRDRLHAYLHGLDPADARYSPGGLLFAHAIAEAIREGLRELDFLRGREPYKYRWGAEDRFTWRRTLRLRTEAGRA